MTLAAVVFLAVFILLPAGASAATYTVTVVKSGTGDGWVGSLYSDTGTDCGSVCTVQVTDSWPRVAVAAVPDRDSEFVGWGGSSPDPCADDPDSYPHTVLYGFNCEVWATGDMTIEVEFRKVDKYPLTVTKSGSGGGIVGEFWDEKIPQAKRNGIICGWVCTSNVGGKVLLGAQPDSESEWVGWSGACSGSGPVCEVTMDEAKNVTAEFNRPPLQTLTVTKTGPGYGTILGSTPRSFLCSDACSYPSWGTQHLIASAGPYSAFVGWGGDCSGDGKECDVLMESPRQVEAEFRWADPFELNLVITGSGSGSVGDSNLGRIHCEGSGSPCQFMVGGNVPLFAVPARGSKFVGWGGACAGPSNLCQFSMLTPSTVTAEFSRLQDQRLALTTTGAGSGRIWWQTSGGSLESCVGACDAWLSGSVTLAAWPENGSVFEGWSGACSGTGTICHVSMDEAMDVGAAFAPAPSRSVTVTTAGNGHGRVVSSPVGIDCGSVCQADLAGSVSLQALPDGDSGFLGWSGPCSGLHCELGPDQGGVITADFVALDLPPDPAPPPEPEATAPPLPGGGTVTVNRQQGSGDEPVQFMIPSSSVAAFQNACMPLVLDIPLASGAGTISDVSLIHGAGTVSAAESAPGVWRATIECVAAGNLFVSYTLTEGGNDHHYTIPVGGITLVDPQGVIYDRVASDAAVDRGSSPEQARAAAAIKGATVTLERREGNGFVKVPSGDPGISPNINPQVTGSDGVYQWDVGEGQYRVTVTAPGYVGTTSSMVSVPPPVLDLHVALEPVQHSLAVSRVGTGQGTVESVPAGISCGPTCAGTFREGTPVRLVASPAKGSTFTGWSGACGGGDSCVVTMDEDRMVTASFARDPALPSGSGPSLRAPRLDPLHVRLTPGRVKRGGRSLARVTVRNSGNAPARATKACVKAPKRLVRVRSCIALGKLAPRRSRVARFRLVVPRKTRRGRKITLRFTVRATGLPARTARRVLKVR